MVSIRDLRTFLIEWNNTFVLDKSFRLEHGIAFNSKEHRNTCQIDIYLQHLENKIFEDHRDSIELDKEKLIKYNRGEWLSEKVFEGKELDDAYDKIDINFLEQNG